MLGAQEKSSHKNLIKSFEKCYEDFHSNAKVKSLIHFDKNWKFIKGTRFTSDKMLMFAKVSLASLICIAIDEFFSQ